jgi:acrylyl-CoA reductase (NADPH)
VVVTGAAGGLDPVASAILCHRGFLVTASTGRPQEAESLGAAEPVERKEFAGLAKHLGKACWAGVIDPVGSTTRANVLAMTRYGGAVAACGLAGGMDLPTSVAPFILRGASLLGFESLKRPIADRRTVWGSLASELDREKLAAMTNDRAGRGHRSGSKLL